ncbi:MAG TPA: ammonia-dependent NAD(+) synthetase [Modicisalibacter sp.]|nr:ammonia-dependent NAD(+) synthetase [Modicisalibacter sp.]
MVTPNHDASLLDPEAESQRIREALGARVSVDPRQEIARRSAFLREQMFGSGQHALALGISGGVDSTLAGRLAQLAVEEARKQGVAARFYAMRLPYGVQKDEEEARMALEFIAADDVLDVDIKPASDAMLASLERGGLVFSDAAQRDFVLGNIKARQRMIAQYAVAGTYGGLVVGTDQAAEAVMGFFTKYGDGACDLAPLSGLSKRQVREMTRELGAPATLVDKVPTADLESLAPQRADEDALGVRYAEIDLFLEGQPIDDSARDTILGAYYRSAHKRQLPKVPH